MCCLAEIKVDQWQEKNGGKIWNILFGGRRGRLTYTGHRLWSSTWPIRTRWLAICSWTRQSPKTRPADWKTAKRSNWVGVKWAKRGHFRRLRWPAPLPPPWSVHRLNRPMKCDPQTATSAPISRPRHSTKHTRIGAPTHRTAGDANPRLTNCYDCSVCVSVCVLLQCVGLWHSSPQSDAAGEQNPSKCATHRLTPRHLRQTGGCTLATSHRLSKGKNHFLKAKGIQEMALLAIPVTCFDRYWLMDRMSDFLFLTARLLAPFSEFITCSFTLFYSFFIFFLFFFYFYGQGGCAKKEKSHSNYGQFSSCVNRSGVWLADWCDGSPRDLKWNAIKSASNQIVSW